MGTNHVNRRNFLKLSATAGAALAIAPVNAQAKEISSRKTQMPERVLGKTGIKLPVLSMGVMRADNQSIVRAAYNSGVIFFDTANGYQNGRNEEMLGDFFADKPRESFFIATKMQVGRFDDGAAGRFLEKFETSMKRLKMSYVDILYIHSVSNGKDVNFQPVIDVLLQLKKAGRTKYIGISTHSNEPEVIDAMIANGNYDVVLTSYNFSQTHLDKLNPALERAAKAGMGIVAMKTMAGGFLDKERTKKVNTKAALKWALKNPNIHTTIPGYTSFEQLEECIDSVTNPQMNREEEEFLAMTASQPLLYCQGCQQCVEQCPKKLPIPDMMRAYMYNYGYQSPALAKEVLTELNVAGNPCGDCESCSVTGCSSQFHIAEKIQDITRLQNVPSEFLV